MDLFVTINGDEVEHIDDLIDLNTIIVDFSTKHRWGLMIVRTDVDEVTVRLSEVT